ncbi:MAG: MmcQ/YjbR family DNA-binding protein [Sciscionella sp.]
MPELTDVRRFALALPATIEKAHFGMPGFRVQDRGFVTVTKDGTRVFLHTSGEDVAVALADDPGTYRELRRGPTLLGIDADLARIPIHQLEHLVTQAWRHRATTKLAASLDKSGSAAHVTTTGDIRQWATALPEVEETSHFLFHVPVFKVRGRTFLGMGKGETTVVFRVSEQQANQMAAAAPATCEAVRRLDARRSFLGLQVQLRNASAERVRSLIEQAWRQQAPKRLITEHDHAQ